MQTKLLIEQHFHGAFGVDFNTATVDDVLFVAEKILKYGIGGIFPTIVTDSIENTKKAIETIKVAAQTQAPNSAKILGIHLEGIFLNPEKKGIHNAEYFLAPTIENYKLIEDDFIKIVTLAPELCASSHSKLYKGKRRGTSRLTLYPLAKPLGGSESLLDYLTSKGVKVQAGHCVGGDLAGCNGVTHLFNAMSGISHRGESTALSALINDDIYTEIIADGVHVSDDALKLLFKSKPTDKILLISDCLPCTGCHSEPVSESREFTFAGETIYYNGEKATSKEGTLAGSTTLLPQIIKRLHSIDLFKPQLIENPYNYHNIDIEGSIVWDENWNILEVKK